MFRAYVRVVPAADSVLDFGQGHTFTLWSGSQQRPIWDFSVNPENGGRWEGTPGDGSWFLVDGGSGQGGYDLSQLSAAQTSNVTHVGFRLLFNTAFTGTIYLDSISIYPRP
jgi:hypothetical protein